METNTKEYKIDSYIVQSLSSYCMNDKSANEIITRLKAVGIML